MTAKSRVTDSALENSHSSDDFQPVCYNLLRTLFQQIYLAHSYCYYITLFLLACLKNCVRVYYNEGYCVDVPVYRRTVKVDKNGEEKEYFELASSFWKCSDARDVTKWFDNACKQKSPDEKNGRQLRRVCRLVKKFARSRESWKGNVASGFIITKLVTECYQPVQSRDDVSFYMTMIRIYQRLSLDLVVHHPIMPNETITKSVEDPKLGFLRDKILDITKKSEILFSTDCTYEKAAQKWNLVFHTNYF